VHIHLFKIIHNTINKIVVGFSSSSSSSYFHAKSRLHKLSELAEALNLLLLLLLSMQNLFSMSISANKKAKKSLIHLQ
jgi:hypothetical protein